MIVKFDHICYSCSYNDEKEVISSFKNYNVFFEEKNKENLKNKEEILWKAHKNHNIIYMVNEEKIPIEITSYDSVKETTKSLEYNINKNQIILNTKSIHESSDFFKCLGAKIVNQGNTSIEMTIKGILDRKKVNIYLNSSNEVKCSKLDNSGFCGLAFIVDKSQSEREKIMSNGYRCTEIMSLKVNGKVLNIFFAIGKQGEIIEFISNR